ncbi:MAG TPA: DbpA RNA binding domain-containing protein [Gemmatimonadaceae bacterium]|nr:DbpA RNA binding domain-containing protein [Gemmatimonadaceae bacterium]
MSDERVGATPDGDSGAAGGTRSQQVVVLGGLEPRTMQAALRPGVERGRPGGAASAPACLVLAPSASAVEQAAREARALLDDASLRVVPVSSVARATRVLALGPVAVAVATPQDLQALRRASAVSVSDAQAIVVLGLDDMLADADATAAIESALADAPAGSLRVASIATEGDATLDAFLGRHLRKARQVTPLVKPSTVSVAITPHYHICAPSGRAVALRTFLDEQDPPSLAIVAPSPVAEADAREALASLGLVVDGQRVQVVRRAPALHTAAVIGWGVPTSSEALMAAMSVEPVHVLFLIDAVDVPAMTAVSGGAARPLTLDTIAVRSTAAADEVQGALRARLAAPGVSAADLALVAPLLDEHDAVEVAAAAVHLFDEARRTLRLTRAGASSARAIFAAPAQVAALAALTGGPAAGDGGKTRLFFNVGKRDNVRPGDLLGAITGESGLPGDTIGSIDVFESHTLVDVSSEAADTVIAKLTGVTVRGRQLHVRRDERGAGGHAGFGGGRGERPERGGRGFDRGGRGGERGGRGGPPRERGGDRGAARDGRGWEDRGAPRGRGGFGGGFGGGRGGAERDRGERPERGGRGGFGGERSGGERSGGGFGGERGGRGGFGGERSGGGFGGRGQRGDEARRAFGDRTPSERTEPRREWASRGEQLSRAQRPSAPRGPRGGLPFGRGGERDG